MEVLFTMISKAHEQDPDQFIPHKQEIHRVQKMLEGNEKEFLSINEMADHVSLSTSYFRRLFKEVTGYSPIQYQNRIKINRAKDLILSGECNVSEAAFAVGFDNVFYFSRLFKKLTGINPSEFSKY